MAPLPPRRVIAVVMDNKAPDTVVLQPNTDQRLTPGIVTPSSWGAAQKRTKNK
ncbi:MAG: hypothetical protein QOH92_3199 [Chloroflexota bacterium]|nr:hypothetical protein [Chloroflexota bacterium]